MKRTERLSARTVAGNLAPGMYADGAGLYLQVRPSENGSVAAKSWIFRYATATGERYMGLGSVSTTSLASARAAAQDAREQRRQGIDPIDARDSAKAAAGLVAAKAMTFRAGAEAFITAHRPSWKNAKHAAQWPATLETYAYPVIGRLDARAIDTGLVLEILEPIWATKTVTAKRLRGRIETVLDWLKVRGHRDGENPARWQGHLDHLLAAPSKVRRGKKHHPALPYSQAPEFLVDLRSHPGMSATALEFVVLTAVRSTEALGARAREFDLTGKVWTVPAERIGKTDKEHRVPLCEAAIKLVRPLIEAAGPDGFIFAGRVGRLSDMAMTTLIRRMNEMRGEAGLPLWVDPKENNRTVVPHGFRSTFRDWAGEETNFPKDVAEMALAHTVEDETEAAYRRGTMFEKRRKLMAAWAGYCNGQAKVGEVVPLRARA